MYIKIKIMKNKTSDLKEKIDFDNVYYCIQCKRFTDVNYLRDKIDKTQRLKSYCYLCNREFPLERVSDLIRKTQEAEHHKIQMAFDRGFEEAQKEFNNEIIKLQSKIKDLEERNVANIKGYSNQILERDSKIKEANEKIEQIYMPKLFDRSAECDKLKDKIKELEEKNKCECGKGTPKVSCAICINDNYIILQSEIIKKVEDIILNHKWKKGVNYNFIENIRNEVRKIFRQIKRI